MNTVIVSKGVITAFRDLISIGTYKKPEPVNYYTGNFVLLKYVAPTLGWHKKGFNPFSPKSTNWHTTS